MKVCILLNAIRFVQIVRNKSLLELGCLVSDPSTADTDMNMVRLVKDREQHFMV